MAWVANILSKAGIAGPAVLDLLDDAARDEREVALLHSADGSGPSVLALRPVVTLNIDHAGRAAWTTGGDAEGMAAVESGAIGAADPLEVLGRALERVMLRSSGQTPLVGWIGGVSYDIGRTIEEIPVQAVDEWHWPLLRWSLFEEYYVFDPADGRWTAATLEWEHGRDSGASRRLENMVQRLMRVRTLAEQTQRQRGRADERGAVIAHTAQSHYEQKVGCVKEYIGAGDVYQANLAHCWSVRTSARAAEIYRRLCSLSPAPYAAFLKWDDCAVISASPELFVERRGAALYTRPIKGTRPRGGDAAEDEKLKQELLGSAKDQAELAMIVDLLRNDLGKICAFGSMKVEEARRLEAHPTVWHTVAKISGQLAREESDSSAGDWARILRAVCPGGSITGAPKIRAMQIIEELEGTRRGWYTGNIGIIGPDWGVLNIAIRTILMRGDVARVWAGGGIVADSEAAAEYAETLVKARAMLEALSV